MTSRVVSTYGLETRTGARSSIGPSALSAAISSAETYWLDSPASISTRPPASLPPRIRTGAQPGRPKLLDPGAELPQGRDQRTDRPFAQPGGAVENPLARRHRAGGDQ